MAALVHLLTSNSVLLSFTIVTVANKDLASLVDVAHRPGYSAHL